MTEHSWDPEQYLVWADERGRPFLDLLARVGAEEPTSVVDLGCGPGGLTALLSRRWPRAEVVGIDASAAMIERARAERSATVRFEVGDLRQWSAPAGVDVLVTNATLQWVPGHLDLLPHLLAQVRPGGWLALQVPGNHDAPSHELRHSLAAEKPYASHLREVAVPAAHDPVTYWQTLTEAGCRVDAWETTYLHVLTGPDPVFSWVSGTGARPTLEALPPPLRERFAEELQARLARAYPPRTRAGEQVVLLPFRRVFAVAQLPGPTRAAGPR